MALHWFKVDTNIAQHDKILDLLERRGGRGIAFSYVCAIAYCVANGTDGFIPRRALAFIHATKADMVAMWECGLIAPHPEGTDKGWYIPNYAEHQVMKDVADLLKDKQRKGAAITNAKKKCAASGHDPDCTCWKKASR